jgi:hypothetical protein
MRWSDVLILHAGGGWDELLMFAGAASVAFVIVKFSMRGSHDEKSEVPTPEEADEETQA